MVSGETINLISAENSLACILPVQVSFKGSQGVERHPLAGTYFKSVSLPVERGLHRAFSTDSQTRERQAMLKL